MATRRRFSREFKVEAVKLVRERGVTLAERRETAAPAVAICLKLVRAFAVVAGAAAAVNMLFSALALAFGTWIS